MKAEQSIEERLMAAQHKQLRQLLTKLRKVLREEPADAGDEEENEIWKQANYLESLLDGFFAKKG